MSRVIELLKQNSQLSGWRVNETATKSYELFFVHKNLETVRDTDTVTTGVTVYVDHDGKKGESSFELSAAMGEAEIQKKIDAAVQRARLVFNEPYELPDGGVLDKNLPSNIWDADPQALGREIADAVFAADTVPGGSINACEIFLYKDTVRVRNSRGVDKTQRIGRVMIEAIPTFTKGTESVELYEDYRFTEFDAAKVTAEIARRMAEVRDRFQAKKPQTPMEISVLLRPMEIRNLLWELADDLNYSAVYSHGNLHKTGDDLQENGTGDKLTVTLKAQVPGSEKSSWFDTDREERLLQGKVYFEADVVDGPGGTVISPNETFEPGTQFLIVGTDGERQVDLQASDGRYARVYVDRDGDGNRTVNGAPEEEIFAGILYAS